MSQENALSIPANDRDNHSGTTEPAARAATLERSPLSHLTDRRIEITPTSRLIPYRNNARTHSKKQTRQIADSIRRFGFTNPVLIDDSGQLIAGHGRVEAAKLLGLAAVPAIRISHLSKAEKRAYILADNRLAEKAGWDREILAIELQALIDLDFEIELTGFEAPYIDMVLDEAAEANSDAPSPEDAIPDVPAVDAPVSRSGDVWALGPHRLLCGNALDPASYSTLMAGEFAEMVFTDPPYDVPIDGNVCGLGRTRHREFAMASSEMTETDFAAFLRTAFEQVAANSANGAIHFVCMDWRHMAEMLGAGQSVYSELKNLVVWNKTNAGMGSFYRSKHELVFVWKVGTEAM